MNLLAMSAPSGAAEGNAFSSCGGPMGLAAARGTALSHRFDAWRGRSGRRYVVSVYDRTDVPDYAGAVALAVRHGGGGIRRLLGAALLEGGTTAGHPLLAMADEVHIHLLAGDRAAREAVVDDLTDGSELRGEPGQGGIVDAQRDQMVVGVADIVGIRA